MVVERSAWVPADFVEHLRGAIPGFDQESQKDQLWLARFAWVGHSKARQHKRFKEFMSVSHRELESVFGRGKFEPLNKRLNFLHVAPYWSKANASTKGYAFARRVSEARVAYFAALPSSPTNLVLSDGSTLRKLPPAVASKDMDGLTTTAWKSAKAMNRIPVNVAALHEFRGFLEVCLDECIAGTAPPEWSGQYAAGRFRELLAASGQVLRMANTAAAGPGFVPQHYVQARSGRLYGQGFTLQSVPTPVRHAAMAGWYEYDISNCHYSIVSQMARKHGFCCPAIDAYLLDKDGFRRRVAAQVGITVDQAKQCLLAILYGARRNPSEHNSIPQEIGSERARSFYDMAEVATLFTELQGARRAILRNWTRSGNARLVNDFGRAVDPKQTPEQQLAHLTQGVEARALLTCVNLAPSQIVLLQHDGFVSTSPLNMDELTNRICDATGYRFSMEEVHIAAPMGRTKSNLISLLRQDPWGL